MRPGFSWWLSVAGVLFACSFPSLHSEELSIQGLSWHEEVLHRPIFQKTFSNLTLLLTLDSAEGGKISVGPLPATVFKKSSQWKTASAVVRRAPDAMTARLILEDAKGKPVLILGENEKPVFHPLTHYEIRSDGDLEQEAGTGRTQVSLLFKPLVSGKKSSIIKPGESLTLQHAGGKWELTLLRSTRSSPSPAKRAFSDEEAALLFDYVLERH